MGVRQGRTILSIGSAALIGFLLVAAPGRFASVAAAERSLSDGQRDKIKGWIAQYGTDDSVNKMVTDILGLTRDNETISSRALAVRGSGSDNEIHQIDILPDGKGYLAVHLHQDHAEVYWADRNFALIFAVDGVRGGRPDAMSFPEAQAGLASELEWWASFADTH
jgi:hypothetical protein